MTDLISREAAKQIALNRESHAKGETARACRGIAVSIDMLPAQAPAVRARPLEEWHEGMGDCVWWCWEEGVWLGEAAWIGSPIDSDWPDYHTHFTPHPEFPPDVDPTPQQGSES